MTDTQPQPIDLATWVQRSTGVSREDAERIVTKITTEAYAQWTAQQAAAPPPEPAWLQPINITFTAEIDTRAIVEAIHRVGVETTPGTDPLAGRSPDMIEFLRRMAESDKGLA